MKNNTPNLKLILAVIFSIVLSNLTTSCNSPTLTNKRFVSDMNARMGIEGHPGALAGGYYVEGGRDPHSGGGYKTYPLKNGWKKSIYSNREGCKFAVLVDSKGVMQSWYFLGSPDKCHSRISWTLN